MQGVESHLVNRRLVANLVACWAHLYSNQLACDGYWYEPAKINIPDKSPAKHSSMAKKGYRQSCQGLYIHQSADELSLERPAVNIASHP